MVVTLVCEFFGDGMRFLKSMRRVGAPGVGIGVLVFLVGVDIVRCEFGRSLLFAEPLFFWKISRLAFSRLAFSDPPVR